MSKHEVYTNSRNELVKGNRKNSVKNIAKRTLVVLASLLLLNQAIALLTGYNVIWNGIKYILNAVDIYTAPVESVSFESDGWKNNVPGSWHIDKSAHWTGIDTAEVVFTLNTLEKETVNVYEEVIPDVILVLDTSLSMEGDKLDKVKEHSKDFVQSYLTKHPDKTIAIVDFDDEGRIVLEFTSDIQKLQQSIDKLVASGNTNYNDALKRVDDLMQIDDYAERNVGVLFLTDGVPCIDTPSEVGTYKMLKEKYELLYFNGIQYEMGKSITQELRNISDFHRYATMETLGDVFYELTQYTEVYEKFVITDYVKDKYFYINDESDISVSYCSGDLGIVELINGNDGSQTVTWDLGTEYKTGSCSATMRIKLTLREEYVNEYNKDFYPTNNGEEATSKLEGENEYTRKSNDTPVLQRIYTVTYDNNPPSNCKIPEINKTENHYFYETVLIEAEQPVCQGYLFKGWEIVTSGVESSSDDRFTMPQKDVTIRAAWSKQGIVKSMTGTTGAKPTLFEIAKSDGKNNNGVGVYTGLVSDKFNVNSPSEEATIYYYTSKEGNNVVFANICWQIVRTTSTGGVKLLYNGEYDPILKCSDTREKHMGLLQGTSSGEIFKSDYLYGDSYIYDESTGVYEIIGNLQTRNYSTDEKKNELIGKYTCKNLTGTCTTLYYLRKEITTDNTQAWVISYKMYAIPYSVAFYAPFNKINDSLSTVGYMYSVEYINNYETTILDTTLWGEDIEYTDGIYTLKNTKTGGPDNTHHYSCDNGSSSCSSVRYYYYYYDYRNEYYYVTLDGGINISEALEEMFGTSNYDDINNNNLNKNSSHVKIYVDKWYQNNIDSKNDTNGISYTDYLEDIVFCNNRLISDYGGWNQNGKLTDYLRFSRSDSSYNCPRLIDQFSISNPKAKLTYPVGLLTVQEVNKMGNSFTNINTSWWTMSPYYFNHDGAMENNVSFSGGVTNGYISSSSYVRPVVSLKPNTKVSSGNGTMMDPYIIDRPAS